MLQVATLVFFPALMVYAALSDLFTMTISNRISIALVVIFVPFAYLVGLSGPEIGMHFVCGFAVLALTFFMFAMGWIGGGDAKLAAATALWIGWQHLGDFGLASSLIGGALTLLILNARMFPLPRWALEIEWISRLHDRGAGVPYGIALAIAGLLTYPQTMLWIAGSTA